MAAISLKEVMQIIKSGEWMTLSAYTADVVKNTGGKIVQYSKCRIARLQLMQESGADTTGKTEITKSAEHNFHFTVNLELKNQQIRKVHPPLIFKINNQDVL